LWDLEAVVLADTTEPAREEELDATALDGARDSSREDGPALIVEDLLNLGFWSSSLLSTMIVFFEAVRNGID
jgi:hypothetical protein